MEKRTGDIKKIVFITPGPIFKISDLVFYEHLSEYFSGTIVSSSDKDDVLLVDSVGSFTLNLIRSRFRNPLFNLWFFISCVGFALRARIRKVKYDLVVTYDPLKTGVFGLVTARIMGARFAPEVNGVYTSPAVFMDDVNKLRSSLKRFLYPKIEARVLKRSDGIKTLFPSQLKPFEGMIDQQVVGCFPAYVPVERFISLDMPEREEILFVGFPFRLKGVDVLIRAFKEIWPAFPGWRLKILGWYPDKTELDAQIGGHPGISHHPPVLYEEMPKHIGSCAILVLPSRTEAMGRVLVEAMAAGKPRIGADIDGIPTVIEDNVDGLLFRPEDAGDLANKMRLLMEDKGLRKRLGEAGRARARREFSRELFFSRLVHFYSEVIGEGC